MTERVFVLKDPMGLHARPAARLVMALRELDSAVTISGGGAQVNGRDVLEILSLGCVKGDEIRFMAEGPDEEAAMEMICRVMNESETLV